AEQAVDRPRGKPAPEPVAAADAPAGGDVGAVERGDEPGDVLGRVLEVAVHRHDRGTGGAREPSVHRRVVAGGPLPANPVDARAGRVDAREGGEGAVGRAVVDEDELERPSVEGRDGATVELVDRADLVEDRYDDRQRRCFVHWSGREPIEGSSGPGA